VYIYMCKNDICWNYSRNQVGDYTGECRGGEFKKIYLTHCKNLCKCHSVPPPDTMEEKKTNKIKKKNTNDKSIIKQYEEIHNFVLKIFHKKL
jgi:hypothetical protein